MSRIVQQANKKRLPCHYCTVNAGMTTDHIVPVTLGGPTQMWNLVPACLACNLAKAGAWPTHDCPKCREAVRRFTGDPRLADQATAGLDGRLKSVNDNFARVTRQRKVLAKQRREYTRKIRGIKRLIRKNRKGLTSVDSSSIVEA